MKKTILAVDDEKDILEMVRYNFEKEGYNVLTACNGKEAIEYAATLPDLILLDVLMPEMDGWEVCKQLKRNAKTSEIPVVFLTAKGTEFDETLGLELGADDYIVKPIAMRILLPRVKTSLRRKEAVKDSWESSSDIIRFEGLEINVPNYTARVEGEELVLTRREFEALAYLAQHGGRVITRQELLRNVWGEDVQVTIRTVDVHVSQIRSKLGQLSTYIETVKGVGYRIKTGVERLT